MAELTEAEGRHGQATGWLRRCLALDPADVKLLFRLGRSLANAGDHRGAVTALRAVLAINPNLGAACATCFGLGDRNVSEARVGFRPPS